MRYRQTLRDGVKEIPKICLHCKVGEVHQTSSTTFSGNRIYMCFNPYCQREYYLSPTWGMSLEKLRQDIEEYQQEIAEITKK